eukprot:1392788-Rhodomonas_salina.1
MSIGMIQLPHHSSTPSRSRTRRVSVPRARKATHPITRARACRSAPHNPVCVAGDVIELADALRTVVGAPQVGVQFPNCNARLAVGETSLDKGGLAASGRFVARFQRLRGLSVLHGEDRRQRRRLQVVFIRTLSRLPICILAAPSCHAGVLEESEITFWIWNGDTEGDALADVFVACLLGDKIPSVFRRALVRTQLGRRVQHCLWRLNYLHVDAGLILVTAQQRVRPQIFGALLLTRTKQRLHESLPREALGTAPQTACEAPSSSSACTTEG